MLVGSSFKLLGNRLFGELQYIPDISTYNWLKIYSIFKYIFGHGQSCVAGLCPKFPTDQFKKFAIVWKGCFLEKGNKFLKYTSQRKQTFLSLDHTNNSQQRNLHY